MKCTEVGSSVQYDDIIPSMLGKYVVRQYDHRHIYIWVWHFECVWWDATRKYNKATKPLPGNDLTRQVFHEKEEVKR